MTAEEASMRHQTGYIFRKGHSWFGRWREDAIEGGQVVRRQRCEKLADCGDRYRCEKDVRSLLDEKLKPLNDGRANPQATLTVAQYAEGHFFPTIQSELKPSTVAGYRAIWRMYLKPRPALSSLPLRDFRCVDAANLLAGIHAEHGISRKTLRHCKALLSAVFTFAKNQGVLDGINPVKDARIPRQAPASKPTHAATPDEVLAILDALDGSARTAVALMFFAGLRPGEARGLRWSDFDGKRLFVGRSVWHTHVTEPKTAESVAPVPVCETLAAILAEHRNGASSSDYILAGPSGKPVDLHNLAARVVRPALSKAKINWQGWYALRRGAATLATQVESPLAAKGLLRHSNLATTTASYIKDVPAETVRAVEKMDALFQAPAGQKAN
jgi:integrase